MSKEKTADERYIGFLHLVIAMGSVIQAENNFYSNDEFMFYVWMIFAVFYLSARLIK